MLIQSHKPCVMRIKPEKFEEFKNCEGVVKQSPGYAITLYDQLGWAVQGIVDDTGKITYASGKAFEFLQKHTFI